MSKRYEAERARRVDGWMKDELADYAMVIRHCSEVYAHFTSGRISKPNTFPAEVIRVAEDLESERTREAIAEELRDALDTVYQVLESLAVECTPPGAEALRHASSLIALSFVNRGPTQEAQEKEEA